MWNLKDLVRAGSTAKCESISVEHTPTLAGYSVIKGHATYATTPDRFRFRIPLHEMSTSFPAEGKAIEFMKWIGKELVELKRQETDEEVATLAAAVETHNKYRHKDEDRIETRGITTWTEK